MDILRRALAWPPDRTEPWPAIFAAAFASAWLLAAWRPLYPQDWALENVLVLLAAWWLLRRHRQRPLSNPAYAMLCLFGIAHVTGSHYTYSEVPYDAWSHALLGISLNDALDLTRNHYDRLVHFLFGFLCFRPLHELLAPALAAGRPRRVAPILAVATVSLLYEQVEMLAAVVFGGDLGQAFLGAQGDVWDAQKDSALALAGALLALLLNSAGYRFAPDADSLPAAGRHPD